VNTIEPSMCADDVAFLSNYFNHLFHYATHFPVCLPVRVPVHLPVCLPVRVYLYDVDVIGGC